MSLLDYINAMKMRYLPSSPPTPTDLAPQVLIGPAYDDPCDSPEVVGASHLNFFRASQPSMILALQSPMAAPSLGPNVIGPDHQLAQYVSRASTPRPPPLPKERVSLADGNRPLPATSSRFLKGPLPISLPVVHYGKT